MSLSIPFAWQGVIQSRRMRTQADGVPVSAALSPAFDPATAVMLGPFAFEVYNDPAPGTTLSQQCKDLNCHYLSDSFVQDLYDGSIQVRIASVKAENRKQKEGSFPWDRHDRVNANAMVSIGPKHCTTTKLQLKESSGAEGHYVPMEAAMCNAYIRHPWKETSKKTEIKVTLHTDDRECIGHGSVDLGRLLAEEGRKVESSGAEPKGKVVWRRMVTLSERRKDKKGPLSSASTVQVELEIEYTRLTVEELSRRKRLSKTFSKAVMAFSSKGLVHHAQPWRGPTGCSQDWRAVSSRVGGSAKEAADMEPVCFIEHKGTDTQVKLWRDEKRKRIVVAFRGTDFLQWRDLLTDMKILQEPWNITAIPSEAKARTYGSYHSGSTQISPQEQQVVLSPPQPSANPVDKIIQKAMSRMPGKTAVSVHVPEQPMVVMQDENDTAAQPTGVYGLPIPWVKLPQRFEESTVMAPKQTASAVDRLFHTDTVSMSPAGTLILNNGGSSGSSKEEETWVSSFMGMLNAAYQGLMSVIPTQAETLWAWATTPSPLVVSVGTTLTEQSFAIPMWGDQGYISNLNFVMESLMTEAINFLSPPISVLSSTVEHMTKAVVQVQQVGWTSRMDHMGEALAASEEAPSIAPPSPSSGSKRRALVSFLHLDPSSLGLSEVPMVHSGFKQAYLSVREPLMEALEVAAGGRKQLEEEQWRVLCTGHSLGGALATLLCQDLSQNYPKNRITMYNFGAPRVGNAAFTEQYQQYNRDSFRMVNELDLVPRFPPGRNSGIFHYDHVGRTVLLGTTGAEIAPGLPIWVEGHHAGICPLRESSERETEMIQSRLLNQVVSGTAYQGHTEATYFRAMNIMEAAKVNRPLCSPPPATMTWSPGLWPSSKSSKERRTALV